MQTQVEPSVKVERVKFRNGHFLLIIAENQERLRGRKGAGERERERRGKRKRKRDKRRKQGEGRGQKQKGSNRVKTVVVFVL